MEKKIQYDTLFMVIVLHIGAVVALFYFSWYLLAGTVFVWILGNDLGLAVGFHRLLTHRGFKTPKWVEYTLTILGSLASQGGHIPWIAIHRKHHQFTEKEGDPHSPRHGFFHSHMKWVIYADTSLKTPEFLSKYAPDLLKDPVHRFLNKFWWLPSVILGLTLLYFFGLPSVLWVICLRLTLSLHWTWLVNSACHMWGKRPFETDDDSTNNWWVAVVTFGEGWHNNHHAFPTRARHGLDWTEPDPGWMFIWALEKLHLARAVIV